MPDDRPRLLYVVTLAEVGGAQAYVRDLLPAAAEEYAVSVAAHGEGPLRDATEALGLDFHPLRNVRRALSPWRDPLGLAELVALFTSVQPAIVHLNSSKAGVMGRLAAAPTRVPVRIFTAHGWAFKASSGTESRLYRIADRAVRPLTTMVVCVSETERAAGLAAGTCLPERTTVIPNAVDVAGAAQRPAGANVSGPLELITVGRLAEPKDFGTLIAALARVPPGSVRLQVLGDGPQRARLEAEVLALGLRDAVEFAGEVADVRERLARADVFVLSSRSEGMPISVLEAMAARLPVVASAVGGLHEVVVDGETGLLVAPGDPGALAAALERLVDDPALRESMAAASRRRAEVEYSLDRWRTAHLGLYRSLLAGRAA